MVNRLELFVSMSRSDNDLLSLKFGKIEGVERLPAFHEYVIGDIHDVVDRLPVFADRRKNCPELFLHPGRTLTNRDTTDDAPCVTRA